MTSFNRLITLVATVVLLTTSAHASSQKHGTKVGDLVIHTPWSRATPKAAKVGAGYLKIENTGATPDRLIKIETSIAGKSEVHSMSITNGVMKMRALPNGVEIPAGESVTLKPGANHIMFMKLSAPIKRNAPFKATLTFEKAGPVDVTFKTVKIGGTLKRGSH